MTKVSSLATLGADLTDQREQLKLDLQALSDNLRSRTTTSVATYASNKLTFDATSVTGPVAVFNITGAMLSQNGEMFFNLPMSGGSPLTTIINVSGTSIAHTINTNSGLAVNTPSVIWNFFEATTISFQSSLFGSVLATKAAVTNGARLNGSIVAGSLNQNAQIHLGTFNGFPGNGVAVVPEPAAWAMMIVGMGFVGAALRRLRQTLSAAA